MTPYLIDTVRFSFIFLFFIISILSPSDNTKDAALLRTGLFFTVLGDICLVLTKNFLLGVVSFCVVQLIYQYRYARVKYFKFTALAAVFIFIILFCMGSDILISTGGCYAVFFLISFVVCFKNKSYSNPNRYFILIGMTLFMCCDICVALANSDLPVNKNLFSDLVWIFYLPSQLFLCLSARKFRTNKKSINQR